MTDIEREYQIRLDAKARVNEETFTCEDCRGEFLLDYVCDHDRHIKCWDCCEKMK